MDLSSDRVQFPGLLAAIPCTRSMHHALTLSLVSSVSNAFNHLLEEFPWTMDLTFSNPVLARGVYHYIETLGHPVWACPLQLAPDMLALVQREFTHLQELGIIRPSSSEMALPLHIALKVNGKWQPGGEYRQLYLVTVPDHYPVPHIQDLSTVLAGALIFSVVKLICGHHQVPCIHLMYTKPP